MIKQKQPSELSTTSAENKNIHTLSCQKILRNFGTRFLAFSRSSMCDSCVIAVRIFLRLFKRSTRAELRALLMKNYLSFCLKSYGSMATLSIKRISTKMCGHRSSFDLSMTTIFLNDVMSLTAGMQTNHPSQFIWLFLMIKNNKRTKSVSTQWSVKRCFPTFWRELGSKND